VKAEQLIKGRITTDKRIPKIQPAIRSHFVQMNKVLCWMAWN